MKKQYVRDVVVVHIYIQDQFKTWQGYASVTDAGLYPGFSGYYRIPNIDEVNFEPETLTFAS